MTKHRRRYARFLDPVIDMQHRASPAPVEGAWSGPGLAKDDGRIGGIVGNRVDDLAGRPGCSINPVDSGIDDLQRTT
jgi:hypothetical protein